MPLPIDQLSIDELRAQLSAYMFFDNFWHTNASRPEQERIDYVQSVTPDQMVGPEGLGFVSTQLRDLPARLAAETANRTQHHAINNTRAGIPVIIQDEGLHGLIGNGATSFPSALGMAASWNPERFEQVAHAIGREARTRGIRQLLSPTLNLGRDPRNGRCEETYGEDTWLASRMAVAYIRGVQGEGVVCTPKHFVANFEGDAGRDSYPVHFSERLLRELLFPPFRAAVEEGGAMSLMAAYGSSDGIPCSASRWLLTDVLRGEWGFTGYVVSDYHSIVHLYELHRVAATKGDAGRQALEAGLDVEFPRFDCYGEPLRQLIADGAIAEETVRRAAERVLQVKERIGLLADPYVDPDEAERVSNCAEHRDLARRMAIESIVLLRNENGVLPLSSGIRRIAVIGPNADTIELGDYSWDLYSKDHVVTPLEGIRCRSNRAGVEVVHARGCDLLSQDTTDFDEAAEAARGADIAVICVGSSVRLVGEARDRTDLRLPGVQADLIRTIAGTGTPTIVFVITGSVHTMEEWFAEVDGVFHAWYAGEEGGTAMAALLFGDESPSGKLPITIPTTVGQCPVAYDHKPSGRGHVYTNLGQDGGIRFPFGHGLTYGNFHYDRLRITATGGNRFVVEFLLKNTGDTACTEVVQLYISDRLACVARPLRQLRRFARVALGVGETRAISFDLDPVDFEFLDAGLRPIVEPGTVDILVGASSVDIRLRGELDLV